MSPARLIQPKDCLGFGKLTENQLMPVVQLVKAQGRLNQEPPACEGRGIVIAGGGRYTKHAWAVAARCRELGWTEGIQVWHLGPEEIAPEHRPRFEEIDVELVDAFEVRKTSPIRILSGWELKVFAAMNCPWRHVLYLDADCHPDLNPEEIFNHKDIRKAGSLFFSDIANHHQSEWAYVFTGLTRLEKEWEAGQWLVDKKLAWMGLRWTAWLNEHSDAWFKLGHGDKLTQELGMRIAGSPFLLSTDARWEDYGIGQYYGGKRFFKHWMASKRGEHPYPPEIQEQFDRWDALSSPVQNPSPVSLVAV